MEDLQLDPIRQVRVAKRWAFAGILWALCLLLVLYSFTLDLSSLQLLYVLVPAAAVAGLIIELTGRWEARTHRRYAYPHRLGYALAEIHDFLPACRRSAELVRTWLDLDAVVVSWLSEDGQTLEPLAASGLPEGWCEGAAQRPASDCGLNGAAPAPGSLLRRPAAEDSWFRDRFPGRYVVYVPLLSREAAHGSLAVVAGRRNPQLGDRRLLSAIGMVLGLALDNCRLYEGQRAHAQHFQELSRMKSDFLSTVSHELRTPLTSIMMGAEMLLEEEETRDPASTRGKLVRNIVKGAARMKSLVEDLVEISRDDDFQPRLELEPAPLTDPINNAVSIVQPLLAAKHQSFDLRLGHEGALARIDRLRFEQVLINLLSNAQRYSPPGGHLGLETRALPSGELLICVTDSGPGVAPEDADMIFEPFYRGDRSGLGLGLAIAKSIVELHNGRIWVEPGEGGGSRFCVAIPGDRAARSVARAGQPEQPEVSGEPAVPTRN